MGLRYDVRFGTATSFSTSYVQTHYIVGSFNELSMNKLIYYLIKFKLTKFIILYASYAFNYSKSLFSIGLIVKYITYSIKASLFLIYRN